MSMNLPQRSKAQSGQNQWSVASTGTAQCMMPSGAPCKGITSYAYGITEYKEFKVIMSTTQVKSKPNN